MTIIIKLAWRNVLRNKRRTVITAIAMAVGLASLIFTDALVIGMENHMIHAATASFMGEGQIHAEGFRASQEANITIKNRAKIISDLENEDIVERFTERTLSFGMITSPANVGAAVLVGVKPDTEKYLSAIDDIIIEGSYFQEGGKREIVIGNKLAENLEAGIGDRIVVTVARAGSGDLSQEMFRISGIYKFGSDEMDKGMAFIRLEKAQEMLSLNGDIHEIVLKFKDKKSSADEGLSFWKKYSLDGNEALGWTKLMPQLKAALDMSSFSVYIIGVLLFGIIAFGIVNTLFMSLYERMFEFGVLRAVGTRPYLVASLIIFEAGFLAVIGILFGAILGFGLGYLFSIMGIDYSGIEYAGVTFREPIYLVMKVKQFIIYPVWVFVFTIIAGIYPAIYAARMSAVDAMRKSM